MSTKKRHIRTKNWQMSLPYLFTVVFSRLEYLTGYTRSYFEKKIIL